MMMRCECGCGVVKMWRVSVLQMWRQAMATRGVACKAVNVVVCRLASMQAAITGALPQVLTCNMYVCHPFRVFLCKFAPSQLYSLPSINVNPREWIKVNIYRGVHS